MAQQSSFQSLATPSVSATGLWSEEPPEKEVKTKASEGGDKTPKEVENKEWVGEAKRRDERWGVERMRIDLLSN